MKRIRVGSTILAGVAALAVVVAGETATVSSLAHVPASDGAVVAGTIWGVVDGPADDGDIDIDIDGVVPGTGGSVHIDGTIWG